MQTRYDLRTNTNKPLSQRVIGFDRTTGKPIYGEVEGLSGMLGGGRDAQYVADETARYETERVKSDQNQSSFSGIKDQEVYNALKQQLMGLSSASYESRTINPDITKLLADYSKQSAFSDAGALMAQNIGKTMEAQKPAIQKAIEGSGTSAGSMQALLSQKLATESSQAASALGAQQATAYGQISSGLMQTQVQQMAQGNQYATDLARLADALKVSESSSTAKSYFSAEEMNPKDGTGGKYGNPLLNKQYALNKSNFGTYY